MTTKFIKVLLDNTNITVMYNTDFENDKVFESRERFSKYIPIIHVALRIRNAQI